MSRQNRVMQILDAMTDDERESLFEEVVDTYCLDCGQELPEADSPEPDHDTVCPNPPSDDDDDEDEDDDADDEDDEDETDDDEETKA